MALTTVGATGLTLVGAEGLTLVGAKGLTLSVQTFECVLVQWDRRISAQAVLGLHPTDSRRGLAPAPRRRLCTDQRKMRCTYPR